MLFYIMIFRAISLAL